MSMSMSMSNVQMSYVRHDHVRRTVRHNVGIYVKREARSSEQQCVLLLLLLLPATAAAATSRSAARSRLLVIRLSADTDTGSTQYVAALPATGATGYRLPGAGAARAPHAPPPQKKALCRRAAGTAGALLIAEGQSRVCCVDQKAARARGLPS
jgi:hypothetical protein